MKNRKMSDCLEESLRKCCINNHGLSSVSGGGFAFESSDETQQHPHQQHGFRSDLDLNSHLSLPPYFQQCLDLKTGEVYYIDSRTGIKVKEDPRMQEQDLYSESDESSSDDSQESSSSFSTATTSSSSSSSSPNKKKNEEDVLVVGGCKKCFMYFMVPKQLQDCPKCNTLLLHFDRSP